MPVLESPFIYKSRVSINKVWICFFCEVHLPKNFRNLKWELENFLGVKALVAIIEDVGSIPSTHMMTHDM